MDNACHAAAVQAGAEIAYALTLEPWGVRRFFVRDPDGQVINVLSHIQGRAALPRAAGASRSPNHKREHLRSEGTPRLWTPKPGTRGAAPGVSEHRGHDGLVHYLMPELKPRLAAAHQAEVPEDEQTLRIYAEVGVMVADH